MIMTEYGSQYPSPDYTLLHLSDTHFVGDGELLHDKIDCDAQLARLLDRVRASAIKPDAILLTGDLADTGRPDAYRRLRAMVEPFAAELAAELVWVMGNHDRRPTFRAGLLDLEPTEEPYDRVHLVGGLRIVVLDSTVPGEHHGDLTDDQLVWLRDTLSRPAPDGTLLALHHPPIPSPVAVAGTIELREEGWLAALLAGTDVRGILAGHLHYSTTSLFAGIPISVASATCYTQDLGVARPAARGQDGAQAYNLIHVYGDRVVHSVVPIEAYPTVSEWLPELEQREGVSAAV
ncbi:phosphodiesterase [Microlunatus sp. GCM10028923]|uniref:phosphodiesterase n=1 Tax=Microlunatus sp. GCM10028923 TaxID=3273400 RepID=UPI0036061EE3